MGLEFARPGEEHDIKLAFLHGAEEGGPFGGAQRELNANFGELRLEDLRDALAEGIGAGEHGEAQAEAFAIGEEVFFVEQGFGGEGVGGVFRGVPTCGVADGEEALGRLGHAA